MQYTILQKQITSLSSIPLYVKQPLHQHNSCTPNLDSTTNSDCFFKYNFNFINYHTIYTANVSTVDDEHLYYKQVNNCILRELLDNTLLDFAAHFLLFTSINIPLNRYESCLIVFTHYNPILYQKELFGVLQELNHTDAIHITFYPHFSVDSLVQSFIGDSSCILLRVYSNCISCLTLCNQHIECRGEGETSA